MVAQAVAFTVVSVEGRETRTIVVGGFRVVVARLRVGTTSHFKEVTDAVSVRIFQALPITVVTELWENTFTSDSGIRVVVASRGAQTADAAFKVTAAIIHVGIRVVVARVSIGTSLHNGDARTIVLRGVGVKVDGVGVITTQHFKGVANAVSVKVAQAVSIAIVSRFRVFTFPGVDGVLVVVARRGSQTSHARIELTGSIVHVGCHVVVAS